MGVAAVVLSEEVLLPPSVVFVALPVVLELVELEAVVVLSALEEELVEVVELLSELPFTVVLVELEVEYPLEIHASKVPWSKKEGKHCPWVPSSIVKQQRF